MKYIILLFIIFGLNVSNIYSQRIIDDPKDTNFQNGDYRLDNGINPFIGTWEWVSDNYSFTVKIVKEKLKMDLSDDLIFYADAAVGWYELKQDGVVVMSSLDKEKEMDKNNLGYKEVGKISSLMGNFRNGKLRLKVKDFENKHRDVELSFLPDKADEARWFLRISNSRYLARKGDFAFPLDIVMKKVSE